MAAEEKAESTAANGSASGGGGNKLVLLLSVVNIVATLSMAGVLVISFQRDKARPGIEDIAAHTEEAEHGGEKAKEGEHGGGHGGGGGHGDAKESTPKKKHDFGKMVTLEQFTVNLTTPGSATPKFVRVNVSLEVPSDDVEVEVGQKMPQVRNAVIDLFNSKRASDLATSEGRDYLKEEIKNALNTFLTNGKIKGVYFTNFALTS